MKRKEEIYELKINFKRRDIETTVSGSDTMIKYMKKIVFLVYEYMNSYTKD